VAEVCFAAQWATIILHQLGTMTGADTTLNAAWVIVPLILIAECFSWYGVLAKLYYFWTFALYVVAIFAGVWIERRANLSNGNWILSVVALLWLFISIIALFRFGFISSWMWRKALMTEGLVRRLEYEDASVKAVSEELTRIEVDLIKEWAPFGLINRVGKVSAEKA